jgi:molecular chaperone HscA
MPIVRHFVADLFGKEPLADIDPDEVVALGAAVQADLLATGGRGDVVLMDVVPLSLGLEMMGGVTEKLIHRNTTVPCGAVQTFTTYADNQTGFDLHVVQGERELVADCRSLARFKLGGIPPMTAGMARLKVTFTVDADGILSVAAREEHTGQEASIRVKPSYGLTDDEVERMIRDSFDHANDDMGARLLTVERVEADRILGATRAALASSAELLVEDEGKAIEAAMTALELAKSGTNHLAIRGAIQSLDEVSKELARRRMNAALEQNVRGQALDAVEKKVTST